MHRKLHLFLKIRTAPIIYIYNNALNTDYRNIHIIYSSRKVHRQFWCVFFLRLCHYGYPSKALCPFGARASRIWFDWMRDTWMASSWAVKRFRCAIDQETADYIGLLFFAVVVVFVVWIASSGNVLCGALHWPTAEISPVWLLTHSHKRALHPFLLIYSFNDCFVIENALVYKPDRWLHKQCTPSISVTTTTTDAAAVAGAAAAHDT